MFHLLGNKVAHFLPLCFLQPFQTHIRPLHGGHFFRPFHALPLSDVFLATPATHTQITTSWHTEMQGFSISLAIVNDPWPDAFASRHRGALALLLGVEADIAI